MEQSSKLEEITRHFLKWCGIEEYFYLTTENKDGSLSVDVFFEGGKEFLKPFSKHFRNCVFAEGQCYYIVDRCFSAYGDGKGDLGFTFKPGRLDYDKIKRYSKIPVLTY